MQVLSREKRSVLSYDVLKKLRKVDLQYIHLAGVQSVGGVVEKESDVAKERQN